MPTLKRCCGKLLCRTFAAWGGLALALFSAGCGGPVTTDAPLIAAGPVAGASVQTAAVGAEGDWSRFRGPTAMGVSSASKLPVRWSPTENMRWKLPLPGPGASSPIVWRDRIYLTCYSGYGEPGKSGGSLQQLKRHLLAIDLGSGQLIWEQVVPAKLPEEEHVRDHGYAANSPVVDADHVYVFFGKTGVFAFTHAGEQVWQADVGSKTHGWGSAASPILFNDLVIVNASVESESLVALNKATGREVWRAGGINEAWNTPLVVTAPAGRDELIVATHGKILAFEPQTGKPLWNCATDITWYMVPSVVAQEGIVYAIGGRSGVAGLAVRTGGSGDVTKSHRLWTTQKGSNVPSPVLHNGHLYCVNDSRAVAICLDAATGNVVFEQRLERAGQFYASLLLADGKVYAVSRDGQCFVWAAEPKFQQLAMNDLRDGGIFDGSPAVAGDQLLIRSDKFLYCIAGE